MEEFSLSFLGGGKEKDNSFGREGGKGLSLFSEAVKGGRVRLLTEEKGGFGKEGGGERDSAKKKEIGSSST